MGLFVFVCFKITCSFLRSRSCCLLTYFKHAERVGPKKCVHPHRHIIPVQCAEELAELYPAQETEVYQTSLDGKSPQDHPKGLVIDTSGKENVVELLHIVPEH